MGEARPLDAVANDCSAERRTEPMIRSFFGLDQNPFDAAHIGSCRHQQEIFDTLTVHCQQGGLCLVLGEPGTGKSVIKHALQRPPQAH